MPFHIGQKVICVDAESWPGCRWDDSERPEFGRIYTVTRAFVRNGRPTVWLAEIARSDLSRTEHGADVGYCARRFRPAVDSRLDVFRKFLAPQPREREVMCVLSNTALVSRLPTHGERDEQIPERPVRGSGLGNRAELVGADPADVETGLVTAAD